MSARVICGNCSRPIALDRNTWYHLETGIPRCAMEFFAIPKTAESRPAGSSRR